MRPASEICWDNKLKQAIAVPRVVRFTSLRLPAHLSPTSHSAEGSLDLATDAFAQISPTSAGRISITWDWIDCKSAGLTTGDVTFAWCALQAPTPCPATLAEFADLQEERLYGLLGGHPTSWWESRGVFRIYQGDLSELVHGVNARELQLLGGGVGRRRRCVCWAQSK
mgnify:CR=1 FL=1